jgi:ribosome maturation factor RimP
MIEKAKINQLIDEFLTDSPLFLVDLKVSGRNQILVYLDGDNGVPISSCVQVSRLIESSLDREVEDFELEVSSVGIDKPLVMPRQFRKNIGREIMFTGEDGKKIKAKLIAADDSTMTIEKEIPKKKKKDTTPPEEPIQQIPYQAAKDVKVQVSFKAIDLIDQEEEES